MIERWRIWIKEWAAGYWFLPTILLVASVFLSFLSIELDRRFNVETIRAVGWIWAGSPDGARAVLSTISGSMITVAGVVFSISIAALSMTGSQFGPRLLRTFTNDRGNQLTLGTFTATFVYCLLILRTVRAASGESQSEFVPYISVTIGLALALLSVAVLIYFIHHVSSSLQAETLVAEVGDELSEAIERLYPQKIGEGIAPEKVELPQATESGPPILVKAAVSGYIQAISGDDLMETMEKEDARILLVRRPGDFVVAEALLAKVWPRKPRSEEDSQQLAARCGGVFALGPHRTPHQDISYPLRQLTEIAVRALSPGINDPFTALDCCDWLESALSQLARREFPDATRCDENGSLRVVSPAPTFPKLMEDALGPLRDYGATSPLLATRLLLLLENLAPHIHREDDREALRNEARRLQSAAQLPLETDRENIENSVRRVLEALAEPEVTKKIEE